MAVKVAREAIPFVGFLAAAALLVAWLVHPWATSLPLALAAFTLWFFRDPDRRTPDDAGALICPADGRVVQAGPDRISIFMNVFDVHVCRTPLAGTVSAVEHSPGRFLAAFRDQASEQNERTEILVDGTATRLTVRLVAGLLARRIVCKVTEGQALRAGQRIGLIQFGSRVDVDLPEGAVPSIGRGERVRAGETVIARLAGRAAGSAEA